MVNVVLHAFEHLAKQSKYCGDAICGDVRIFHRRGGPIFYIVQHWCYTRPPRLWHLHNWTRVSLNLQNNIVTFQWHVIMFCKCCKNHGVIRMCSSFVYFTRAACIFISVFTQYNANITPEWQLHINTPNHEQLLHLCVLETHVHVVWLQELTFATPYILREECKKFEIWINK